MTPEKTDTAIELFVYGCLISIAAGPTLFYFTGSPWWLLLCAPIIIFLA